jgi:hypothetical protein
MLNQLSTIAPYPSISTFQSTVKKHRSDSWLEICKGWFLLAFSVRNLSGAKIRTVISGFMSSCRDEPLFRTAYGTIQF